MIAFITRMRLTHAWMSPIVLIECWLLRRHARRAPGYITSFAALEDRKTVMNVSVWSSCEPALFWSGHPSHVDAVRQMYRWAEEV